MKGDYEMTKGVIIFTVIAIVFYLIVTIAEKIYCKKHNIRPPFLEIPFWYEGDSQYTGSCEGCGWYDGKKWREELSKKLK